MKVQIGKMILYGILTAVFYIVVPLVLFEYIGSLNLMTFSQEFKTSIIVIGIIGVVISMLRHLFPPDTSANRVIAFAATVYSGIYLFYVFGGFTPGVALGTYAVNLPTIQVRLGLQLIAWLLLASSAIRALQYLVEAIEIGNQKEYKVTKKKFRVSMIFKAFGTIMGLVIAGYFGSLVYSGTQLGFDIHDTFGWDHDDNGTFSDPSDDTINLTMTFDVSNQGWYAIYDVVIAVRFYTVTTADPTELPENTKIGESLSNYYSTFHSFTITPNNDVVVVIDPTYVVGFLNTSATLEFRISFSTLYAGILLDLNMSLQTPWTEVF